MFESENMSWKCSLSENSINFLFSPPINALQEEHMQGESILVQETREQVGKQGYKAISGRSVLQQQLCWSRLCRECGHARPRGGSRNEGAIDTALQAPGKSLLCSSPPSPAHQDCRSSTFTSCEEQRICGSRFLVRQDWYVRRDTGVPSLHWAQRMRNVLDHFLLSAHHQFGCGLAFLKPKTSIEANKWQKP